MGKMVFSQLAVCTMAVLMGLGSFFAGQTSHAATNPWSRAIGEAKELQWETKDLRNRLNRLYAGTPATQLSCSLDESACALVEMVQKGADLYQLQMGLQTFNSILVQLGYAVAQDCRIHSDSTTVRLLKNVDNRYRYLVTDLSKCQLPTVSCPTHGTPSYSNPWASPSPYPSSQPVIPPGYSMPPVIPFGGNPIPSTPQQVPHYWQGSLPPNSAYPRMSFDFEHSENHPHGMHPSAISSHQQEPNGHPPIAAEILSLLIQRASSR